MNASWEAEFIGDGDGVRERGISIRVVGKSGLSGMLTFDMIVVDVIESKSSYHCCSAGC